MKIWVVRDHPYEQSILAIFSSKELAEKYLANCDQPKAWADDYELDEMTPYGKACFVKRLVETEG